MDEGLRAQIEVYLSRLDHLARRGREIRDAVGDSAGNAKATSAARAWQVECGVVINELSGGSKSHWLARAFSAAFLLRGENGRAAEGAAPSEIADRVLAVLQKAASSLADMADERNSDPLSGTQHGAIRRFDFVHNSELRAVVEQAYADSRSALESKRYGVALKTSCGVLEAIVTDALEHAGDAKLADSGAPASKIADWPFETRLAIAEKAGLIRGGCARLPSIARTYRDNGYREGLNEMHTVTERDARVTGQVLNVVIRDLDPGR